MKRFNVFFVIMIFLLQGCATMPKEADLNESLRSRAEEYWKLRMQDKYEDAYRMEDISGLPPFIDYRDRAMRIKKFDLQSFSIEKIKVEGNKGTVNVRFSFIIPPAPKPFSDVIIEEWVFKDGEWLHRFSAK